MVFVLRFRMGLGWTTLEKAEGIGDKFVMLVECCQLLGEGCCQLLGEGCCQLLGEDWYQLVERGGCQLVVQGNGCC